MKKLLRNPVTHQFLSSNTQWTDDPGQAEPVADYLQAAAIMKALGVKKAELYYCFTDSFNSPRWDFAVPVEASFAETVF